MKLRYGYLGMGIVMGLILLWQFLTTLPDGKLHVTFCDVGQGDAAYLRFPDGRDMLIDGGPNATVLSCLASVMPFWDRHLDGVVLSHPDEDHYGGLIDVFKRYSVGMLIKSNVANEAETYREFEHLLRDKNVRVRLVSAQDRMRLGPVVLTVLWPTQTYFLQTNNIAGVSSDSLVSPTVDDRNNFSVILHVRYGTFDLFFPGDADEHIDDQLTSSLLSPDGVEVLKVPHHGSATGMTGTFVSWLSPKVAIISVGKNNRYNFPRKEALDKLSTVDAKIFRTDQSGSISLVSNGKTYTIHTEKKTTE